MGFLSRLFRRNRAATYGVNHDPGFFVVARHERQRAVITETTRAVTGYEVTTSDARGDFSLSQPTGWFGARPATYLLVSKPGFPVYCGDPDGANAADPARIEGGRIILEPTGGYREERLATWRFEQRAEDFLHGLDETQRQAVREHLEARRAHLVEAYPAETAEAERSQSRRSFRIRSGLEPTAHGEHLAVLAAAALPDGGLALVTRCTKGRDLVVLDAEQRVVGECLLEERGSRAGLTVDDSGIILVDGGGIRRFDHQAKPHDRIPLTPSPGADHPASSLSVVPNGFLLGLDRAQGPPRVRCHAPDGGLLHDRELPSIATLARAFLSPQGAIMIQGNLQGSYADGLEVAGLRKRGAMPSGIVRLANWSAEPEVLWTGIDTAAPCQEQLWAYAANLYDPEDHDLVVNGVPDLLRQLLLRLSWDGEILATRNVTDAARGWWSLKMGDPRDDRLIFFRTGTPVEVSATLLGTEVLELQPA